MQARAQSAQWLEDLSEDWIEHPIPQPIGDIPPQPKDDNGRSQHPLVSSPSVSGIQHSRPPTPSQPKATPAASPSVSTTPGWPASRLPRPNKPGSAIRRPPGQSMKIVQSSRTKGKENDDVQSVMADTTTKHILSHATGGTVSEPVADVGRTQYDSGTYCEDGSVLHHSVVHNELSTASAKVSNTPEWKRRLIHGERGYGESRDLFSPHALEGIFQRPPDERAPPPQEGLSFLKGLNSKTPDSKNNLPVIRRISAEIPSSPPVPQQRFQPDILDSRPARQDNSPPSKVDLNVDSSRYLNPEEPPMSDQDGVEDSSMMSASNQSKSDTQTPPGASASTSALSLGSSGVSFSEVPIIGTRTGRRAISGLHYRAISNASAVRLGKQDGLLRNNPTPGSAKRRTPLGRSSTFSPAYMDQRDVEGETTRGSNVRLGRSTMSEPDSDQFHSSEFFDHDDLEASTDIPDSILAGTPDSVPNRQGASMFNFPLSNHAPAATTAVHHPSAHDNNSKSSSSSPRRVIDTGNYNDDRGPPSARHADNERSRSRSSAMSSPSAVFGAGELDEHVFGVGETSDLSQLQGEDSTNPWSPERANLGKEYGGAVSGLVHQPHRTKPDVPANRRDGQPHDDSAAVTPGKYTTETVSSFAQTSSLPSRSPSPNMAAPGSRVPHRYRVASSNLYDTKPINAPISSHPTTDLTQGRDLSNYNYSPAEPSGLRDVIYTADSVRKIGHLKTPKGGDRSLTNPGRTLIPPQNGPHDGIQPHAIFNFPHSEMSASSPAKASLPKRRRTYFPLEHTGQTGIVTKAGNANYIALNGAGTGSRQSSASLASVGHNHSRAASGVKPLAGQKRKDARHIYSNAVRAGEDILRQRAITQPGRLISPQAKRNDQSFGQSSLAYDDASLSHTSLDYSRAHAHLDGDPDASIDSLAAAAARLELDEEKSDYFDSQRRLPNVGTKTEATNGRNSDNKLKHPPRTGETRPRRKSLNTQDYMAEAVKIMDYIRQRNHDDMISGIEEIDEESEEAGGDESSNLMGYSSNRLRRERSNENAASLDGLVEEGDESYEPSYSIEHTDAGSFMLADRPSLVAVDASTGISIWDNRVDPALGSIPPSRSNSKSSRTAHIDGVNTRFSTATSTGSQRSDTCNVATLVPEAVAHLIPPALGGMVFDERRKIWILDVKRTKVTPQQRVNDLPEEEGSKVSVATSGRSPDEPEGWSLDRIPDLSVDESRERIFLHGPLVKKASRPELELSNSHITPEFGTAMESPSSSGSAPPFSYTLDLKDGSTNNDLDPSRPRPSRPRSSTSQRSGNESAPGQVIPHLEGEYLDEHHFHDISNFLLSEMPDFTINQEDELLRPLRRAVAQGGQIRLESRFLRSTGALIRALQASSTDDYDGWTTLESVSLRNQNLESLYLLKEFCPVLTKLDVSGNRLRHVLDIGPAVRALDVSHNLISGLTHWGSLLNLQFLDISDNQLESLSGLSSLVHLRELVADDNCLESLRGLDLLDGLQRLSLKRNRIASADFEATRLDRLVELDISSNRTHRINGLHRLRQLTVLNADDNELDDFSWGDLHGTQEISPSHTHHPSPAACRSLIILSLCGNRLTRQDVLASLYPNLQRLYLDENRIPADADFSSFDHLKRLSLRGQKGKRKPPVSTEDGGKRGSNIFQSRDLRQLFLSRNLLPDFALPTLPLFHLNDLELSFCGLQALPPTLSLQLPNLQRLNVNFNALTDLVPLIGLGRLESLMAAGNRIARLRRCVAVVSKLVSLKTLDFRDNPMTAGVYPPVATEAATVPPKHGNANAKDSSLVERKDHGGRDSWPGSNPASSSERNPSDGLIPHPDYRGHARSHSRHDDRLIPAAIRRWTPDPRMADDSRSEGLRGRVQLPQVEPLRSQSVGLITDCPSRGEQGKITLPSRTASTSDSIAAAAPTSTPSDQDEISSVFGVDESFVGVLDNHTQLRRAVYHVLIAASCLKLTRLDGRVFGREQVLREVGLGQGCGGSNNSDGKTADPTKQQGRWEVDIVLQRLVALGVVKSRTK